MVFEVGELRIPYRVKFPYGMIKEKVEAELINVVFALMHADLHTSNGIARLSNPRDKSVALMRNCGVSTEQATHLLRTKSGKALYKRWIDMKRNSSTRIDVAREPEYRVHNGSGASGASKDEGEALAAPCTGY